MNAHLLKRWLPALCLLAAHASGGDLSPRSDLGPGGLALAAPQRLAPTAQGSSVTAVQRGNDNQASVSTSGHGHDIVLSQRGSGNQASVAATGSNSRVAVGQTGNAHSVDIQVNGNNRMIEVQQTGNGRNDTVILY